jgi:(2Fe-2S) ferredoxin
MADHFQILLCDGPSCGVTHESDRLVRCLRAAIAGDPGLAGRTTLRDFTCFGRCDDGPNVFVRRVEPGQEHDEPDPAVFEVQRGFYPHMDEPKLLRVLREHCGEGRVVEDLVDDY